MAGGRHLLLDGDRYGLIDDLRFPAQTINIAGPGEGAAQRDTNTGFILYDAAATESIAGVAQLPHSWRPETKISPHIHIRGVNATDPGAGPNNVVQFRIQYKWYNKDAATPSAYTEEIKNFTLPAHVGGLEMNYMGSFTNVDGTGKVASSLFEWTLSRIGGATADTYPADCVLVEFDIHYISYTLGTADIYGLST